MSLELNCPEMNIIIYVLAALFAVSEVLAKTGKLKPNSILDLILSLFKRETILTKRLNNVYEENGTV